MDRDRLAQLSDVYRTALLDDVLPFWIRHAVDREHGGFTMCLDRDGTVVDTDKGIWQQARFTWLLGTLCCEVEPRAEWLELCEHGIAFLRAHGFDDDGRMFFQVARNGDPIRKRRYVFTEAFTVAALAAHARATGSERSRDEAIELFRLVVRYLTTPGLIPPKTIQGTRPLKGFATPMILLVTAQILRQVTDDPICDEWIDRSIDEIERDFVKPELGAVLEAVAPDGGVEDHFDVQRHAIKLPEGFSKRVFPRCSYR